MNQQSAGKQNNAYAVIAVVAIAAATAVIIFFLAEKGAIELPFLKKSNSAAQETTEVVTQTPVEMSDYSALAADAMDGVRNDQSDSDKDESVSSDSDYVFPTSSDEIIPEDDIESLDSFDLRIAINEIYARHGYTFPSNADMRSYFDQMDWYYPDDSVNSMKKIHFSSVEKDNIDAMSVERERRKADGTWPY